MSANIGTRYVRAGVGLGLLAAVLNGVCWVWFVRTFVPLDVELPEAFRQEEPATQEEDGDLVVRGDEFCMHCPRFSLMNRGVLGGYAPVHFELLALSNVIPLFLSARETLRYEIRVVNPVWFAIWASLQWIVGGIAVAYLWQKGMSQSRPG